MAVQSNDNDLKDLLVQVGKGELQLPEFQRSWVWDDSKIRNIPDKSPYIDRIMQKAWRKTSIL